MKAIFFDIDDTLYSTSEFADQARRNAVMAMQKHGLRLPFETIYTELLEVVKEFTSNYDSHFDKLLMRLPKKSYAGINTAILVAAGVVAYHETKTNQLKPYDDVIPFFKKLAKLDIIRGVISNGLEVKQAEKIVRLGIYEFLTPTAIFISDQVGISKPNRKLFSHACDECGIKPKDAACVGNSIDKDIEPAASVGMITVLAQRKPAELQGTTKPRHVIRNFAELEKILAIEYNVSL